VSASGAQNPFFLPVASAQLCQPAQPVIFLSGHSRASVSGRHAEFFFVRSQPHSSAGRAVFLWGVRSLPRSSVRRAEACPVAVRSALTARTATFCDRSHLHKLCQPAHQGNFFVQSLPRRSIRAAGRAEICFLLACPVASAQQSARAKLFFLGARSFFFCCPVPSAQLFDLCGAWNLCSTLFQNPASEI
jgi:hypothetical protein